MKKLYLIGLLLFSAPMVHATGIPCASCGIMEMINKSNLVTLGTEIKSNTVTPKEIILLDMGSSCFYSGVLTRTLSENKYNLVINVTKKVCQTKTDKVAYSVLNIKSNENYSKGTQFKLYHEAVEGLSDAAAKMPAKGATN
ncbi:hypothetical protein BAA89_21860 [Salmonella enterica]|nr:hypothetical protein [Salmonella enterica]